MIETMLHARAFCLQARDSLAAARQLLNGFCGDIEHHGQPRMLWIHGALPTDHVLLLQRLSRRCPRAWVMSSEPSTFQGAQVLLAVALWADDARLGIGVGQGLQVSPERAVKSAWEKAHPKLSSDSIIALTSPHVSPGFTSGEGLAAPHVWTMCVQGDGVSSSGPYEPRPRYLDGMPTSDAVALAIVDTSTLGVSPRSLSPSESTPQVAPPGEAVLHSSASCLEFRLWPWDSGRKHRDQAPADGAEAVCIQLPITTLVPSGAADVTNLKVLVVEDDPITCRLVRRMLEQRGVACDVARDGHQGLEAAVRIAYDAIISDCRLPGIDGLSLARTLRASAGHNATTPIFAMTANVPAIHRQECLDAGMDEVFGKPIDGEALANALAFWSLKLPQ